MKTELAEEMFYEDCAAIDIGLRFHLKKTICFRITLQALGFALGDDKLQLANAEAIANRPLPCTERFITDQQVLRRVQLHLYDNLDGANFLDVCRATELAVWLVAKCDPQLAKEFIHSHDLYFAVD